MVFRSIFVVAMLALTGCAQTVVQPEGPGPAARSTGLLPQEQRSTDLRIAADRKVMSEIQLRLRRLNESGLSQNNYPLAKAQCWLDTAWSQYHENDRTGYIEESLAESLKIVQALEANKAVKVGYDTPLVARSTRLRDDLWAQLNALKMRESSLVCNARTVACGEVRLVRAGHAEQQTGWRQANAHVQMAEDAVRRASAEAANWSVRQHGGDFDLDLGALFHQRRHLHAGHGREVAPHHLAVDLAQLLQAALYSTRSTTYQVMRTMCSGPAPASLQHVARCCAGPGLSGR
jgi:hypothetical protein